MEKRNCARVQARLPDIAEIQARLSRVKSLIRPRREKRDLRAGNLASHAGLADPRGLWYDRGELQARLDCGGRAWPPEEAGEIPLARKRSETVLLPGGICNRRMGHA